MGLDLSKPGVKTSKPNSLLSLSIMASSNLSIVTFHLSDHFLRQLKQANFTSPSLFLKFYLHLSEKDLWSSIMGTQLGHMQIHKNKHFKFLMILWVGLLLFAQNIFAANPVCTPTELADFKKLYIELQKQLNYEGKDAYLDAKGVVQLKAHVGKDYEGKLFEEALFREYQNTLRKVGKIYQAGIAGEAQEFKSNPLLVHFMKVIEDESPASKDFIAKTKIKDVIDALAKESEKKFGNTTDKKYAINAGDKYLLEKLLTHAQDRLCTVSQFEIDGKPTKLFKDVNYLKKIQNAPLNRLVQSLKQAKINKDSKIDLNAPALDLVDPDVTTKSAVAEHMQNLANWVKKNKHCDKKIRSIGFMNSIQANIQSCNYNLMLDTLSRDNSSNLEAVLHFINANERLLNRGQAKAETALDEMKLEGFISTAFDNMGTMVRCTQLSKPGDESDKKIFIRNLPYDPSKNSFDKSGIVCKQGKNELKSPQCLKTFDLISDSLGRGLELRPKKGITNLSFSVKNSPDCDNMVAPAPPGPRPTPTIVLNDEICKAKGLKLSPIQHLVYDPEQSTSECTPISNDICKKRGLAKTPDKEGWFLDLKTHSCQKINADYCKSQLDEEKKQPMIVSPDGLSCVKKDDPLLTEESCRKKGEDAPNGPILTLDTDSKQCIPLTDNICGARGLKMQPPKYLVFDQDTKKCEENSQEICEKRGKAKTPKEGWYFDTSEHSCQKISDDYCKSLKDKENNPMVLAEDKLSCTSAKKEPVISLDDKQCKAKDPKTYYDEATKACKAYDQAYCDQQSTKDKKMLLKKDGTGCEEKPQEYTDEICSKQNKEGKTFKAKADKSGCEEVKAVVDPHAKAKEDCLKLQADFVKTQGGLPTSKYRWNSTTNKCDDLKPDPKVPTDDEDEDETYYDFKINNNQGTPPPRFVPKSLLPGRTSIDRGMP